MLSHFRWCCSDISYSVPTLAQAPEVTDVEILDTVIFHSIHDNDSWLQRSEASLSMKKALLSVFFLCKGICSFRPQSSVSTLSWNSLLQCGLAPVLSQPVCTTAAHYPGFSSAAELHLCSGVSSLKNMVANSRKTTETRSVGLVFYLGIMWFYSK